MRGRFGTTCICAVVLGAVIAPTASGAGFSFTSSGGLLPSYSSSRLDYVTSCAGNSTSVISTVPSGTVAYVSGRRLPTGRSTVKVTVSPGQRFEVVNGRTRHSVRCTPADFPKWTVTGTLPKTSPFLAMNATTLTRGAAPYGIVIDANGAPVWWRRAAGVGQAANSMPLAGGTIGFWHGDIVDGEAAANGVFEQFALNGTSLRNYRAVGGTTDLHETHFSPGGNTYVISVATRNNVDLRPVGGRAGSSIVDNVIQEIDSVGSVVWSWRTSDHIPVTAASRWFPILEATSGTGPLDVFHMNSIEETPDGGLIVSFRHLDAVFKIRKSDGATLWKLGGTASAQSLTVRGDSFPQGSTFGGQHDARLLADGTMTVYDNGSNANGAAYAKRAPRLTRWRIDPTARTATLVERITDAEVKTSFAAGGARRLSDGSWVASWAHWPWVRAYSPTHRLVFNLKQGNGRASYRAIPVSGAAFTRAAFVAGMDAQFPR